MKERIGFVAIGQAGGNIGQLFENKGFPVLYVNTSTEDLSTLKSAKHKYHIEHGEGCNKDRNKAKQLVIDDFDNIVGKIDDTLKTDIIFVIFASGGGTGSGAGPMLIDLMLDGESDQDRSVGAITILPSNSESIKSQVNAYECFTELVNISSSCCCFIIDNNAGEKMELNPKFVNAFTSFVEIPDMYKSDKGNIDTAEVIEALKSHGMATVESYKVSNMASIVEGFNKNIYAPLQMDHVVKYISVACSSSIKDLSDIEKSVGTAWDSYRAYTENEAIVMLSGLSYPTDRLKKIHDVIHGNRDVIVKNLSSGQDVKLEADFDFLNTTDHIERAESRPRQSRKDIINRYCKKR